MAARSPLLHHRGAGFVTYRSGRTAQRLARRLEKECSIKLMGEEFCICVDREAVALNICSGMDHAQWQLLEVCGYGHEARHPIIELSEGPREIEICGYYAASQLVKEPKISVEWHHHGTVLGVEGSIGPSEAIKAGKKH